MKLVQSIVFRYLSAADFFNIYKPPRTEARGGGQTYIDFPTVAVALKYWRAFFGGVEGLQQARRAAGPSWTFPVHSLGIRDGEAQQRATIYQRRAQSVCLAAQRIQGHGQNRILAWRPEKGFPQPQDPDDRHQLPSGLAIYLVRTTDNQVWAGWFSNAKRRPSVYKTDAARDLLNVLLNDPTPGVAGYISLASFKLNIDETNRVSPFTTLESAVGDDSSRGRAFTPPTATADRSSRRAADTKRPGTRARLPSRRQRSDAEIVESLFGEDEEYENEVPPAIRSVTTRVRLRNSRAVKDLKELYHHKCQITGDEYTFQKPNGTYYTEAHHLVSLGSRGADDPRNIIIVSPLIHRMLHYANVSKIDLAQIKETTDGSSSLEIAINNKSYRITWHRKHAEKVRAKEAAEG